MSRYQFKHLKIDRNTTLDGLRDQRNTLAKQFHTGDQQNARNQEIMREVNEEYTQAMIRLDDIKILTEIEPFAKEKLMSLSEFIIKIIPDKGFKPGWKQLARFGTKKLIDQIDAVTVYDAILNLLQKKP